MKTASSCTISHSSVRNPSPRYPPRIPINDSSTPLSPPHTRNSTSLPFSLLSPPIMLNQPQLNHRYFRMLPLLSSPSSPRFSSLRLDHQNVCSDSLTFVIALTNGFFNIRSYYLLIMPFHHLLSFTPSFFKNYQTLKNT
jgi:hypothetical protein